MLIKQPLMYQCTDVFAEADTNYCADLLMC